MATANKSLKFFMRPQEEQIVTFTGPESFKDDEGNPIEFEVKVLPKREIDKINNIYRKRSIATDKKGNPIVDGGEIVWRTERDPARSLRHIVVAALQYPKLDDKALMDYYKCVDITDMPLLVFNNHKDYDYVTKHVLQALGIIEAPKDEDTLNDAKN